MTGITEHLRPTYTVSNERGEKIATITDKLDGRFDLDLRFGATFGVEELELLALALSHATATFHRSVANGAAFTNGDGHGVA